MNGIWILNPRLGWVWVSNEPWGWMPYHFGTWQLSPTLGWVWIPGGPAGLRHWEPARVNWVRVGDRVGWVAKSPNDRGTVPANIQHGVITRPDRPSRPANDSNEILTGKTLQGAMPLQAPPHDFASRASTNARRSEIPSTIQPATSTPDRNQSIVFDRNSQTFINRDGAGDTGNRSDTRAGLMPRSNSQTGIPNGSPPPPGSMNPQTNRVILPPAYPVAPPSLVNVPVNGIPPARIPATPPSPSQPNSPPPVSPGQMRGNPGPPAPTAPRPVAPPQPSAPHPPQGQFTSAPRAAPSPAPAPNQKR
jgi:hypothetical protein